MAANRADVDLWINTARKRGCKYIISMCDTFDYDDYPVYCKDVNDLIMTYERHAGINMQNVNEIIMINDDGSVTENLSIQNIGTN